MALEVVSDKNWQISRDNYTKTSLQNLDFKPFKPISKEKSSEHALLASVRAKQLALCEKYGDKYDADDVEYMATDDRMISRVLAVRKDEVAALKLLDETLQWRKSMDIAKTDLLDFPTEIWRLGGTAIIDGDRDNDLIFWARAKCAVPFPEIDRFAKTVCACIHEKLFREGRGLFTAVVDFGGAGCKNVDMSMAKFLTQTLPYFYPGLVKRVLFVNVPVMLRPLVILLTKLMASGPRIHVISGSEIFDFIPYEKVPKYLGGANPIDFTKAPEGAVSWRERMPTRFGLNEKLMLKFEEITKEVVEDSRRIFNAK